ncbi:hypothetical protein UFOVP760_185 [uncultured Caudovirales phage]|uniref:Uncharacterized protein n=1 Tax=uncultured Caudovirales phage TaxID=2100421 RepID=A0A6J7X735_9CAUD|nr:hypothetical protein UFOVP760_185 [uncultured Caudovirales phage]
MSNFNKRVNQLFSEMAANVAGGTNAVTGPVTSGDYGNQFPSQNDSAYAPGDSRTPTILGAAKIKSKKKKNKINIPIQRRSIYLPGM